MWLSSSINLLRVIESSSWKRNYTFSQTQRSHESVTEIENFLKMYVYRRIFTFVRYSRHVNLANFTAIDYKLLTSKPPKLIETLIPAVFNNETPHLVNFLIALPAELKQQVQLEDIFEKMSEKIFFNGVRVWCKSWLCWEFSPLLTPVHFLAGEFNLCSEIRIVSSIFRKNIGGWNWQKNAEVFILQIQLRKYR